VNDPHRDCAAKLRTARVKGSTRYRIVVLMPGLA
jgi:hypothetical protein